MKVRYVETRIQEALKQAGGNQTRAIQIVMAMAMEDAQLMQGLAKPHLKGIVAHAIGHVVNNLGKVEEDESIPEEPELQESLVEDGKADEFGLAILKAVAGENNPKFGQDKGSVTSSKRGKASKRHIDAINYMASRSYKSEDK